MNKHIFSLNRNDPARVWHYHVPVYDQGMFYVLLMLNALYTGTPASACVDRFFSPSPFWITLTRLVLPCLDCHMFCILFCHQYDGYCEQNAPTGVEFLLKQYIWNPTFDWLIRILGGIIERLLSVDAHESRGRGPQTSLPPHVSPGNCCFPPLQCGGSGMFIPDPTFFQPGSLI